MRRTRARGDESGTAGKRAAVRIKPPYLGTRFEDCFRKIVLSPEALGTWRENGEPDDAGHDRFRNYVYGTMEREYKQRHHKPRKGPALSRQARDLERIAKAYMRQAKKDPAKAYGLRARAADYREASKLVLELSKTSRDPLKAGSDIRHTMSAADRTLLQLLGDVGNNTGKPPFKVLAPIRKAWDLPYNTPNALRAFASRHQLSKSRS